MAPPISLGGASDPGRRLGSLNGALDPSTAPQVPQVPQVPHVPQVPQMMIVDEPSAFRTAAKRSRT